ncbi:hypothetical protein [Sedimenticola hydrogenitrophicus]|uniref:hypothetical protein n=1 Tax=Sedimenticola hydrogenitrophicus TaxID=2967975 RepID=UPI0021A4DEC5|nr:hypothetical protein [Sedimenticola hydrogenitrophicus]
MRIIATFACLSLLFAAPSAYTAGSDNQELQGLVDQLRELTERARQQRAADRWLLNELEELVSRHDWPWRNELLSEDFADGDYDQNPRWQVHSGRFWVDSRLGLRSRSEAASDPAQPPKKAEQKQDLGKALLGALLQDALRGDNDSRGREERREESREQPHQPAEIRLPLPVPPVFDLQIELSAHNPPSEAGQIEFSLDQGELGDTGYRLVLMLGERGSLELLSRLNGRTRVIERLELDNIGDGRTHAIEWRRGPNGRIELLLDEQPLLQVSDHSFRHPFSQLAIRNQVGDFAIGSIRLYGN